LVTLASQAFTGHFFEFGSDDSPSLFEQQANNDGGTFFNRFYDKCDT
jgi:hypothetical protein